MIVNKDFRKRVDFVMRQGWKNIEKMYNNEASKYDVTFSIGFTLISIDPENGSPSTSIGPIMGLESNSISRILNSMENKNLLRTRIDQSDLEAFHRVSLQVNEIIEQGDIFKT